MSQSLSGQFYLDPKDSGDLLMFVCDPTPDSDHVEVTPVGLHRMWPRRRASMIPLINDFKTYTLPKLQSALAVAGGTIQFMVPDDVNRFLAQAKESGVAQVTACQWLLSQPLLPHPAVEIVVTRAALQDIVCPDCHHDHVAGPDEDGCYDCQDCGRCFDNQGGSRES